MIATIVGFGMFSVGLNTRVQNIPSRTATLESRTLALEARVIPLNTTNDWISKCASYNSLYVSVRFALF